MYFIIISSEVCISSMYDMIVRSHKHRIRCAGRCWADSGSPPHNPQNNSPRDLWPENSWTDSLHRAHTPDRDGREDSPPLTNTHTQIHYKNSQSLMRMSHKAKPPESHYTIQTLAKILKYENAYRIGLKDRHFSHNRSLNLQGIWREEHRGCWDISLLNEDSVFSVNLDWSSETFTLTEC